MSVADAAQAFAAVFPAELPDKTMVATIVLTTRYSRPFAVWLGAASAFTVQVVIAVTAGRLLALLPGTIVQIGVAVLFATGAVLLWRGSDDEGGSDGADAEPSGFGRAVAGSFGVVLLAEFGDLTQLATAGLAAASDSPVATGLGALAALWSVAALAVVAGTALQRRLPVRVLRRVAAGVFAALSLLTLGELVLG